MASGTFTFFFTDVVGSTRLWQERHDDMGAAIEGHDRILGEAVDAAGGRIFKSVGDGVMAVFPTAVGAVVAAVEAQRRLRGGGPGGMEPLLVRMAIHSGQAEERDGDFFGLALSGVARLLEVAHGGQVLVSEAAERLSRGLLPSGVSLVDLGEHRLRDLEGSQRVFQVAADGLSGLFPPLRSMVGVPSNLAVQATSFVGRVQELAEVEKLIRGSRLVTLTGAGGSGKTRLALATAERLLDEFPDGVWFVDLAPLADPGLVAGTVVATLRIVGAVGDPVDELGRFLRQRRVLVVLDNCEHLVEAVASLVSGLLASGDAARFLATSRELLGVRGEVAYRVPSLPLPDADETFDRSLVRRYDAMRLFEERAASGRPGFVIDAGNVGIVASICRRVDGMPLAIELAAARLRHLPVDEIASRLDDRFHLLAAGTRDAPARHQTLEATIDWSHDLLDDHEQILYRRLAVFAGGFTLESAEAICGDAALPQRRILDLLTSLADKSLVTVDTSTGRFGMLETIRSHARRRLDVAGEHGVVAGRHAEVFVHFAEAAEEGLLGPDQLQWLSRLRDENDNLRAALRYSIDSGDAETSIRVSAALAGFFGFWHLERASGEAVGWIAEALGLAGGEHDALRAKALTGLGHHLAKIPGRFDEGERRMGEALDIYRRLDDGAGIARVMLARGGKWPIRDPNYGAYLIAARELAERAGDWRGVALAHHFLGWWLREMGQHEDAGNEFGLEMQIAVREGNLYMEAWAHDGLARAARSLGRLDEAVEHAKSAVDILREFGDLGALGNALQGLGMTLRLRRQYAAAVEAHQEELAITLRLGAVSPAEPLINLGTALWLQGDLMSAWSRLSEGLRHLGDPVFLPVATTVSQQDFWHDMVREALKAAAGIRLDRGNSETAASLLGAAEALVDRKLARPHSHMQAEYDSVVEAVRGTLDESRYEAAMARGRAMSATEAIAFALAEPAD